MQGMRTLLAMYLKFKIFLCFSKRNHKLRLKKNDVYISCVLYLAIENDTSVALAFAEDFEIYER